MPHLISLIEKYPGSSLDPQTTFSRALVKRCNAPLRLSEKSVAGNLCGKQSYVQPVLGVFL